MPIQWSDKLRLGIAEIDEQHNKFIEMMNSMYDAVYGLKSTDELGQIIRQLSAYAEYHFATEEKYFEKFKYEFTEEHKQQHHDLKLKVAAYKDRYEKEGKKLSSEIMEFMEDWLVNHLEHHDRKYVQCFHDHGLN